MITLADKETLMNYGDFGKLIFNDLYLHIGDIINFEADYTYISTGVIIEINNIHYVIDNNNELINLHTLNKIKKKASYECVTQKILDDFNIVMINGWSVFNKATPIPPINTFEARELAYV